MSAKTDKTFNQKKIPLNLDSWDDVIAAFENDLFRHNRSEATLKTYLSCLNVFCRFYLDQLQNPDRTFHDSRKQILLPTSIFCVMIGNYQPRPLIVMWRL